MGRVMATAEQIKAWARLRRLYMYSLKVFTGKTDEEIAKGFGVSVSMVKDLCRRVKFEQTQHDAKEETKDQRFQPDLAHLLPILERLKESKEVGQK